MTTLIAWAGVDSQRPSALYLASDSQFTWAPTINWLYGRKLYSSADGRTLLGYCGDVIFASQTLSQAISLMDVGLLTNAREFEVRNRDLLAFVSGGMSKYPEAVRRPCSLLHAWQDDTSEFFLARLDYSGDGWSTSELKLPAGSNLVVALGSGADPLSGPARIWSQGDAGGTSRAVFSAFCDHIASGSDLGTGGPPQLAALYRGLGKGGPLGVFWQGLPYLFGANARSPAVVTASTLEWRDRLFQRCDWATGQRLDGAQVHVRPEKGR